MTIGQRVKVARKAINLNQTNFGNRIGVSQATIGLYETNARPVTDRVIMQLCQAFNINESWLRTGDGDMFVQNDTTLLQQLSEQYSLNISQQALIKSFLELSDEQRSAIVESVCNAADSIRQAEQGAQQDTTVAKPKVTMSERERAHVLLDQEMDAVEQDASALHTGDRKKA